MSISVDFLDWDSDATQSFFRPAMEMISPDVAIKKIDCSVWYKRALELDTKQRLLELDFNDRIKQTYDLFEIPQDDKAFFQSMKERASAPPENEKEAKMTPEELKAYRDPKGLCDLPFESPLVQNALAELRKELQTPPIEKIKNVYLESLQKVKELTDARQNVEMDRIKIEVVFSSKSDLNNDNTLSLEANKKTKDPNL